MSIVYNVADIYGACGVCHIHEYSEKGEAEDDWSCYHPEFSLEVLVPGQAGLCMAAFIQSDEKSEKAYDELKSKFKIVYESSWRINKNSNNMFKFVVYDGEN